MVIKGRVSCILGGRTKIWGGRGGGNGCEVHAVVAEVVTRQCSKTWWKAMALELSRCARDCNFPSL